jgi:hypothetical protein
LAAFAFARARRAHSVFWRRRRRACALGWRFAGVDGGVDVVDDDATAGSGQGSAIRFATKARRFTAEKAETRASGNIEPRGKVTPPTVNLLNARKATGEMG